MKQTENVARIEDIKKFYKILLGKSEENIPFIRRNILDKFEMCLRTKESSCNKKWSRPPSGSAV